MMPSFGIVYGKYAHDPTHCQYSISDEMDFLAEAVIAYRNVNDPPTLEKIGDRTGLIFFFIALYGSIACGMQHFLFGRTGAKLTGYLRSRVFAITLGQRCG